MSPVGLRPEKGCADVVRQKNENYRPDFSSERAPHINKSFNCLKIIKERRAKFVARVEIGA
jgi:hypothetical protein